MSGPPGFEPVHTPPPQSSRPFWPIVLVVGALIVLAAAIGVWSFLDRGPGATPTPAAVVTPSPSPPVATPTTTPTGEPTPTPGDGTPAPDVRAEIDAIVAQIPGLRELDELREVPYEFVTREQFQDDLSDLIADETDPEQLAREERLLKRLGLLPPEMDLLDAILELYGSQVAAFYRPDTGAFYIIGGHQTLAPFDRMVVAHEYTHALQDQHFDLEGSRITDPSEGDAALAQLAAIEGDATLLMFYWGLQNLTQRELAGLGDSLNPADLELLESMPPVLRRQLEFPYTEGFFFSLEVFTSSAGGWAAIDETLRNPPTTTEQILHPEKYFAGEAAVPVDIPDLSADLGAGWSRTYEQAMGELNIQVWVGGGEEPSVTLPGMPPEQPYADVAAGWGGDRLAMYESGTDGWAIWWEIAWDTPADAADFVARADELQPTLDGVSRLVTLADDRVLLLVAHDQATLDALGGMLR